MAAAERRRLEPGCRVCDVHAVVADRSTGVAASPSTYVLRELWTGQVVGGESGASLDLELTEAVRHTHSFELARLPLDQGVDPPPWVFHQDWADDDLTFVCMIYIDPARDAETFGVLSEAVTAFHAEPGCLGYDFHTVSGDPRTLVLIDRYASRGALERHLAGVGIARMRRSLPELITRPSDVYPIRPLRISPGA